MENESIKFSPLLLLQDALVPILYQYFHQVQLITSLHMLQPLKPM